MEKLSTNWHCDILNKIVKKWRQCDLSLAMLYELVTLAQRSVIWRSQVSDLEVTEVMGQWSGGHRSVNWRSQRSWVSDLEVTGQWPGGHGSVTWRSRVGDLKVTSHWAVISFSELYCVTVQNVVLSDIIPDWLVVQCHVTSDVNILCVIIIEQRDSVTLLLCYCVNSCEFHRLSNQQ